MKHSISPFIISVLTLLCISACDSEKNQVRQVELDLSEELIVPSYYIAGRAAGEIMIDGRADETAWQFAPFTKDFVDIEGTKTPAFSTRCKLCWDDEYLYIFAELEETHIWGDITERDAIIYFNNDFEVFIDPEGSGEPYGEIEINALGTVWDLLMTRPYRLGGKAVFDWNLPKLKTAVHHRGSLNDPTDLDTAWSVEMAVPLQSVADLRNHKMPLPRDGDQWRINFSRVHWQHALTEDKYFRKKISGQFIPEENWVWSPQGTVNMHIPERWGYLQFSREHSPTAEAFIKDRDMIFRLALYHLFDHFCFGPNGYRKEKYEPERADIKVKWTEGPYFKAVYRPTNSGFEILATSPHSKIDYVIDQEGRIRQIP